MLLLMRAQAQSAPEAVEEKQAQRDAKDVGQDMKKGIEHGGLPASASTLVAKRKQMVHGA
jgi:hypothetical protein